MFLVHLKWHARRCNIVSGYIFVLYLNIYGIKYIFMEYIYIGSNNINGL